jgi:hypothetical protein
LELKQSTFEELIDSEHLMLVHAEQRYGKFYRHARACSLLLSVCVQGINADRTMFGRFLSLMKKHHTLALFSTLRLHKVQAMMNLRQVLEAGASAAFAIANPEKEHFAETDEQGLLDPTSKLTKKRYEWLNTHYRERSDWIKSRKEQINMSAAHANIVSSHGIFREDAGEIIQTPFFDIEDEYVIKADLQLTGSVALHLMDLLYGVNRPLKVVEFCAAFALRVGQLAKENDGLLTELKATDRFKRALGKFGPVGNVKT